MLNDERRKIMISQLFGVMAGVLTNQFAFRMLCSVFREISDKRGGVYQAGAAGQMLLAVEAVLAGEGTIKRDAEVLVEWRREFTVPIGAAEIEADYLWTRLAQRLEMLVREVGRPVVAMPVRLVEFLSLINEFSGEDTKELMHALFLTDALPNLDFILEYTSSLLLQDNEVYENSKTQE